MDGRLLVDSAVDDLEQLVGFLLHQGVVPPGLRIEPDHGLGVGTAKIEPPVEQGTLFLLNSKFSVKREASDIG
jgi:hypothetical protein